MKEGVSGSGLVAHHVRNRKLFSAYPAYPVAAADRWGTAVLRPYSYQLSSAVPWDDCSFLCPSYLTTAKEEAPVDSAVNVAPSLDTSW